MTHAWMLSIRFQVTSYSEVKGRYFICISIIYLPPQRPCPKICEHRYSSSIIEVLMIENAARVVHSTYLHMYICIHLVCRHYPFTASACAPNRVPK